MKNRTLATLAVVSLGLFLLAIIDPWSKPGPAFLGRIVAADTASTLHALVIRDAALKQEIGIVKEGGSWRISGDKPGQAEPNAVRQLISAMTLLRASREARPAPPHGLTGEAISVHYESAGGETGEFSIGALSLDGRHRWIGVGGQSKALLVEAHLVAEILEAREKLRSRRLLETTPSPGTRLRLSRGDQWLQVDEGRVTWSGYGEDSQGVPVSDEDFAGLRHALGALEFLQPWPDAEPCKTSQQPVLFADAVGGVEIRECGPCSGGLVALSTQESTGCVDASLWNEVLRAIAVPVSLVDRAVLPTRRAEAGFTLRCGKQEMRVDLDQADDRRLQQWWQAIDSGALAVERRVPPADCRLVGDDWQVLFGRIGETWYARVPDSYLSRALEPEVGMLLRIDAALFESLDLISEDPLFATRIRVEERGRTLELERSELLDAWRSKDGTRSDAVATQWALGVRAELAGLRAERFATPLAGQRIEGSSAKARLLEIDFESPPTGLIAHYQLWVVPEPAGLCRVQLEGKRAAWLAKPSCEALLAEIPQADAVP